jgi:hypothetical protein
MSPRGTSSGTHRRTRLGEFARGVKPAPPLPTTLSLSLYLYLYLRVSSSLVLIPPPPPSSPPPSFPPRCLEREHVPDFKRSAEFAPFVQGSLVLSKHIAPALTTANALQRKQFHPGVGAGGGSHTSSPFNLHSDVTFTAFLERHMREVETVRMQRQGIGPMSPAGRSKGGSMGGAGGGGRRGGGGDSAAVDTKHDGAAPPPRAAKPKRTGSFLISMFPRRKSVDAGGGRPPKG